MTIQEGIQLAVKGLNAAIQRDMNSGDGFDIYTITKEGVKQVITKEISTKISI